MVHDALDLGAGFAAAATGDLDLSANLACPKPGPIGIVGRVARTTLIGS